MAAAEVRTSTQYITGGTTIGVNEKVMYRVDPMYMATITVADRVTVAEAMAE